MLDDQNHPVIMDNIPGKLIEGAGMGGQWSSRIFIAMACAANVPREYLGEGPGAAFGEIHEKRSPGAANQKGTT
jgi:hypothetical protein